MKHKSWLVLGVTLLTIVFCSPIFLRSIKYLTKKPKDAAIIIAIDSDETMKNVFYEFKDFSNHGYSVNKYPELEKLYNSKTNWHWEKIEEFSTSIKMQSFGAEKEITFGNYTKLLPLLDDCIAGYRFLAQYNHETSAITYILPAIKMLNRVIFNQSNFPKEIKNELIIKLGILEDLIKNAPDENTNNFKNDILCEIKSLEL